MSKNDTGGDQHSGESRSAELPWGARFILYLVALLLAASMIVLPIWSIQRYGATTGSDLWGPMIAVLIGLTTMTISGIFVFMSFRIDRGTKLTAQWTASKIATSTVTKLVQKVIGKNLVDVRDKIEENLSEVPKKVGKVADDLSDKLKDEVPEKVSEVADELSIKLKDEVPERVSKMADDLSEKLKEEMSEKVSKVVDDLSDKLKDEVKKETATAKKVIVDRFNALEGEMKNQFARVTDQIETSLTEANVEKLIREAVDVHVRRDRESTTEGNGPEQTG